MGPLEIIPRDLEDLLPDDITMARISSENKFHSLAKDRSEIPSKERILELLDEGHFGLVDYLVSKNWSENRIDGPIIELLISREKNNDWKKENWSRRLLEIDSKNIVAIETLIGIAINNRDEESALRNAEKLFLIDEGNQIALNYLIEHKRFLGEWEDMMALCETLLNYYPNDFFGLKALAEAQTSVVDHRSLDTWSTVLEIGGLSDQEMIKIARNYYNSNEFERVVAILGGISEEKRSEENVLELLARSFYSLKDWEGCYSTCSELVSIFPENMIGLRLRMRSMKRMKNTDGTIISARAILESQQNDTEALRNLIRSAASILDWEAVEEISDVAIEDEGLKEEALRWKARAVTRLGKENAVVSWEEILKNSEEDIEALLEIGKIHYNNYENQKAEEFYEKILKTDSENLRAKRALASSKIRRGRLLEAIPILNSLCEKDEGSVKVWELLIETFLRLERRREADFAWSRLIETTWKSEDQFFVALEVALRFHWNSRVDWIMKTRSEKVIQTNILFPRLAEVYLRVGDISTAWGYLEKGGDTELHSEIDYRVKEILKITATEENELREYYSNGESLWVQGLVVREIIRKCRESYPPRIGRKKVALVSSSLNRGGAERQLAYTFRGLDRSRFDCELLVQRFDNRGNGETYFDLIDDYADRAFEISEGTSEERMSSRTRNKINEELFNLLPNTTIRTVRSLIQHFENEVPDLVHCWQDQTIISASIASLMCGVPRIMGSARSMRPDEKSELHIRKRPHLAQCMKFFLSDTRISLTTNSQAGKISYSEWLGIPPEEISVIHNGVDFEFMEKSRDSRKFNKRFKELGIKKKHKIVGGVFRLEEGKRVELWLDSFAEALKKESALRGIIVGSGRMEDTIEEWVGERNLENRVSLVGSSEDVCSWLEKMNVFLLTSRTEGLPNVIIEAQGFGVPCISTDVGGVREVIDHGRSGFVVDSSDSREIGNSILLALGNKNKNMSIRAKRRARKIFSVESMIKNTHYHYSNILSD